MYILLLQKSINFNVTEAAQKNQRMHV